MRSIHTTMSNNRIDMLRFQRALKHILLRLYLNAIKAIYSDGTYILPPASTHLKQTYELIYGKRTEIQSSNMLIYLYAK